MPAKPITKYISTIHKLFLLFLIIDISKSFTSEICISMANNHRKVNNNHRKEKTKTEKQLM